MSLSSSRLTPSPVSKFSPEDTDEYDPENEKEAGLSEKNKNTEQEEYAQRFARLKFILEKSTVYTSILAERMEEDRKRFLAAQEAKKDDGKTGKRDHGHHVDGEASRAKRFKGENGEPVVARSEEHPSFEQPALVTGAKLKQYQLEGVQWMVSLDQNGISGILADEMGLGKTLQTIAFSAYLRECHNTRPFLIVCPLNVLHNWYDEYKKFAPSIPVCIYHGTPSDRAKLRRTVMVPSHLKPALQPTSGKSKSNGRTKTRAGASSSRGSKRRMVEEEDPYASFPIIVTTYEMIIKDRLYLAKHNWGYIVVDEGHRLKNLDCTLMREIKKYSSAGRMILTGTPLHNNLAELWSLMNFILPDIFDDLDAFQEWFSLPMLQSTLPSDQTTQIISSLHAILKPFLLRRLKADVLINDENGQGGLPPKKEYVLYAPLSVRQKEAYQAVLSGNIRRWLLAGGTSKGGVKQAVEVSKGEEDRSKNESTPTRHLYKIQGRKNYIVDGDDDEYFEMLDKGMIDERGLMRQLSEQEKEEARRQAALDCQSKLKIKAINNMKLQNTVMQLRKVCSHPFLFDWPIDQKTNEPVLGAELVNASGKMMVLDRLLRELLGRGHRVLVFSQFVTMLDIIEDWATDVMGWKICRIDGKSSPEERREQMNLFQLTTESSPKIFLLSTRAGGLGINLTAADTVIFYDQDWNPQMDAQAQDRAHRIGQTKPVLVYRLVSAHTVEDKIMQRATEKRKLEAMVIAKGKFKKPAAQTNSSVKSAHNMAMAMADMAADLLRLEVEKIDVVPDNGDDDDVPMELSGKTMMRQHQVLSDTHLRMLLDRRPEVFKERGLGWSSFKENGDRDDEDEKEGKTAFAVYEGPRDQGNGMLAAMMAEDATVG